ncbi:GNAT family N-acetyltransferase [Conexibacter sp. DBS9H8]|uniref:GNAT family N-acetyltransferase n=1 Tax=Conexibacter sp. DBS9H8 TaxID=2937801 RepID=UPI00200C9463|nr:GNAT family N-acetyltransferase [Conexibacter sp. DBS9H8]
MSLVITPVRGFRELQAFVKLPERLHAGTPWIIQLRIERYAYLTRATGAFFKHGTAQYFLARRDGRIVGRISAHVSHRLNAQQNTRWGLFGFFDFEQDQEICDALLTAAEGWLRAQGCDRMVGPFSFTPNDEAGILIKGHHLEPMIRQGWNPPYYQTMVEAAGLTKAMDMYHWELDIADRTERMLPILPQLAQEARDKHGLTVRRMTRRSLWRDLDQFIEVYNAAWAKNWGFVPYTKADKPELWVDYQLVFAGEWFMIVEGPGGELVAMAATIPDPNQVQERMKGRLLPFGWFYLIFKRRFIDRARVGFLGVMPAYQHTGAGSLLYMEHYDTAPKTKITHGEAGWILETNRSMNRGLEAMGGHITKIYRAYERIWEEGAVPAAPPERIRRYNPPAHVLEAPPS